MILPKKHIKLSESLFALGALVLSSIKDVKTVDEIWSNISSQKEYSIKVSFDNYILTLDYLYAIGAIDINAEGRIFKCI
ncbi:MAG: ABC-three component system middle component 6 [Sarcina sp.]